MQPCSKVATHLSHATSSPQGEASPMLGRSNVETSKNARVDSILNIVTNDSCILADRGGANVDYSLALVPTWIKPFL